jgi:branched-subunit amino acid transport protein
MNIWVTILGMAVVTYLTRVTPMLALKERSVSPKGKAYLSHVPVAVLTALVAPGLLVSNGSLFISLANREMLAGLVCIAWAFKSKSMLQTILAGAAALAVFSLIGP